MIYATVLTGRERKRADTFIQGTKRVVCLSDISNSVLAVSVTRSALMQVKIEEELILSVQVTPEPKHFELQSLLTRKKKASPRRGLLQALRRSEPEVDDGPSRKFTVMFRDGGPNDRVVASYEFELVDADLFTSQYRSHFELVEGTKKPARFTTDARSVDTAKDCWHCGAAVKPGCLCANCGSCQKDPDAPEHEDHD